MGSSESTARSNATDENEGQPDNGSSSGAGTALAIAAATTAVAAYGISRMLSGDTEPQERNEPMKINAPAPEPYWSQSAGQDIRTSDHVVYEGKATWSPPPRGRFKVNTDGGCLPDQGYKENLPDGTKVKRGPSGYAGILRDDCGRWVGGFRGFIDVSDCLTAEFHGILNGLKLLDKRGLKGSFLESDSEAAVAWIKQNDNLYRRRSSIIRECWSMIEECKGLIEKNGIIVNHCSRDVNKCADKLADMAMDKKDKFVEIVNLPYEIKPIVDRESSLA